MNPHFLLDTHAAVWWFTGDERFPQHLREQLSDSSVWVFVSAASAWEVATKHRLGKMSGVTGILDRFHEYVVEAMFEHLPVAYTHGLRSGSYKVSHKDPFDRMIAAQAELEDLMIVTQDPALAQFPVRTVW